MGFFSVPKVVVLKESSNAKEYLQQLETLLPQATGETAKKIEKEILVTKTGIAGEENILFELKNSGMDMVVLHDLYFKSSSGTSAQIDFLVLTPKMNFVIECKNLFGNIEITNKGDFIRTVEYGGKKYKEGIYSPVTQNQRHLQVIKECRADYEKNGIMRFLKNRYFENFFRGLIVLANPKTIVNDKWAKKEVKEQVIRADQLIDVIKRINRESKELAASQKELVENGEKYLVMNQDNPINYLKKFEEMIEEDKKKQEIPEIEQEEAENMPEKTQEKICPRCGKPMVLREAKKGAHAGEKFYGCSGYPKCRYTEKI